MNKVWSDNVEAKIFDKPNVSTPQNCQSLPRDSTERLEISPLKLVWKKKKNFA